MAPTAGPNACTQPVAAGQGEFALLRFAYDMQQRMCTQFTYTGLRGNMNNFLTQQDCEQTCPVFVSACANNADPLLDVRTGRPAPCGPAGE
jgi:hypothetical protein